MWAEWQHATGGGIEPADDPRWRCRFQADLLVLDLRDEVTRQALDVRLEQLTGPWSPDAPNEACIAVAAAAQAAGADGFIVPSAARPGAWCVDVFPSGMKGLRLIERRREVPAPLA